MTKIECEKQMKQYETLIDKKGYHKDENYEKGNPNIWIKIEKMVIEKVDNREHDYYVNCICINQEPQNLHNPLEYIIDKYTY